MGMSMGGAQQPSGNFDREAYDEWNSYVYSQISGDEKPVTKASGEIVANAFEKQTRLVGLLNLIVDCGFQPQNDSQFDWDKQVGTEDGTPAHGIEGMPAGYSADEKAYVMEHPDAYFITVKGKRKQCRPSNPVQEFAFYFDFPDVMLDYSKHPNEECHKLGMQPLRVCYNGWMRRFFDHKIISEGFYRKLRFQLRYPENALGATSGMYKLVSKFGIIDQFIKANYDSDVLEGAACSFAIEARRNVKNGKDVFYQPFVSLNDPQEVSDIRFGNNVITRAEQIPACDTKPLTIPMNAEKAFYTPEVLSMIKSKQELKKTLPLATSFYPNKEKAPDYIIGTDWDSTTLSHVIGWNEQADASKPADTATQQPATAQQNKVEPPQQPAIKEPPMDFDDSIPF